MTRTTRIITTTNVTMDDGQATTESSTDVLDLFTFDELDSDVQDKIVAEMCDTLARGLEVEDIDGTVRETWAYALAEDAAGEGSRPDLEEMVQGWSLNRDWDALEVRGTLTPQGAPKLPWPAEDVDTGDDSEEHDPHVVIGHPEYTRHTVAVDMSDTAEATMHDAIRDAMHAAVEAGRAQHEYLTGEEYARERIAESGDLFTFDGERH